MKTTTSQQPIKPPAKMQPFKCPCGFVLGWTDGVTLAVDNISFEKIVTGRCAGCGKCNRWAPARRAA